MVPPQVHRHLQLSFRAKGLLSETVGEPGSQGAGMTGTQGTGTPPAAMTAGLVGALHMPNGGMLTMGT